MAEGTAWPKEPHGGGDVSLSAIATRHSLEPVDVTDLSRIPAGYKVGCTQILFPRLPSVVLGRHHISTRSSAMKFLSSVIAAVLAASTLVGAAPIGSQEIERKSAEGLSLLLLRLDADPVWKTEEEKWDLKKSGIDFMDVTETWVDMQTNPSIRKGSTSKEATTLAACTSHDVSC